MADYLLDTNILRYWYDGNCPEHAAVRQHIKIVCQPAPQTQFVSRLFISTVTIGEIEYGHRSSGTKNIVEQQRFLTFVSDQCPEPLPITKHVGVDYGRLKAWLFDNYSPKRRRAKRAEELVDPTTARELGVDENDIWIAAHAVTHNLVLVTNDSRGNFGKLLRQFEAGIRVEYWAR